MRIGIYNFKGPNGEDVAVQQAYEKILAHNGIPSVRLRIEQPDFWEQVRNLSLFIMRFSQHNSDLQQACDLMPIIEQKHNVKCYPNLNTGWHYDDKVKQYHLLHSLGFQMTKCWVFYGKAAAMEWVEQTTFPIVFKLRGGAGSQNVVLVRSRRQAQKLVKRMFGKGVFPEKFVNFGAVRFKHFSLYREVHHLLGNLYRKSKGLDTCLFWARHKNYVLFQKFLPGNDCDTRVTVIGERAFAFRRLVREDDFRASGSGRVDYDTGKIDLRCVELAFEVSRKMGFQSMAYDFLKNEKGEPEFCEISYTYVSSAVHDCPGYWDTGLNWHEGQYWPEYLHLVDALGLPDLKAPEMDY